MASVPQGTRSNPNLHTGMHLINYTTVDKTELARDDFITAEDYESGTSETLYGDAGGAYHLRRLLDTGHLSDDESTEDDDSWQVDAELSDSISESSELGASFRTYCLNCSDRRHGAVCERCGHDSTCDALDLTSEPELSWRQPDVDHRVAILYDERMTLHQRADGNPHPERPDRLRAIMSRMLNSGLAARCTRLNSREAMPAELLAVHSEQLVKQNMQWSMAAATIPDGESLTVSSDLYINKHTFHCAKLAAGSAAAVAEVVARKEYSAGAAIVRPPGHHAESGNAMGFCFFNNAAVAARAAQKNGAQKVMIVDWDVHHGNGTQHMFYEDPSVLYVSLHRHDGGSFYPGTGKAQEVGAGQGQGYTVNIPWDCGGMGDDDYIAAFQHVILPIAKEYGPDMTILSAGFDAAEGDPLGGCRVSPMGYAHLTCLLSAVAPLVLLLEGGYNLKAIALSTEACMRVLLGEKPQPITPPVCPSYFGWRAVQQAIKFQRQHWTCFKSVAEAFAVNPEKELLHGGAWNEGVLDLQVSANLEGRDCSEEHGTSLNSSRTPGSSRSVAGSATTRSIRRRVYPLRRRLGRIIKRQRCSKSEWQYKISLAIHHNALKVLAQRKRKLVRQSSSWSCSSQLEQSSFESAVCQQSVFSHPPNGVFKGANISKDKLKLLQRFHTL